MSENKKEVLKGILLIVIVFFITLGLRKWVFTSIKVEGSSMYPTLEDKNRVFGVYHSKIERFDIVTFPSPYDSKDRYVKRVIGLPGDAVSYKNDVLYINGEEYSEPYLDENKKNLDANQTLLTDDFTFETLKENLKTNYNINLTLTSDGKVPEGKIFVMGDNRRHSTDGRFFGFINEKDIVAEVKFRFYPLNQIGGLK